MAARKDSRIKTKHREAIQTSMLINRLQDHILGKVELSQTQVRAIQILLNKSLPDLRSIEHVGEDGLALPLFRLDWGDGRTDKTEAGPEAPTVQ